MADKIGATKVYAVAFFDAGDGTHFHLIEGGSAPMPATDLHKMMLGAAERLKIAGDGYTQ
jgi:hypothetical protein